MRPLHETRRLSRLLALVLLCSCSAPLPARDGSLVLDSPSLQFLDRTDRSTLDAAADQPGSDHGGADMIRDGSADKGPPDKSVVPVDPCPTSWSSWSCTGSPLIPGGCVASCGQYVLSCVPAPLPLLPQACTCAKGSSKKTCSGDGLLCDACHDSMKSCCSF